MKLIQAVKPIRFFKAHAAEIIRDLSENQGTMIITKNGDVGRWMVDGTLEFHGRNDHQVQIRGFRVEPGEIESRLSDHPLVEKAVVTARKTARGWELIAYATCPETEADRFDVTLLRRHLQKTLPFSAFTTENRFKSYFSISGGSARCPGRRPRAFTLGVISCYSLEKYRTDRKVQPPRAGDGR